MRVLLFLLFVVVAECQWTGTIVTMAPYNSNKRGSFCLPEANSVIRNYTIKCPNGSTTVQNSCYVTGGGTTACYGTSFYCNWNSTQLRMDNDVGHSTATTNFTIAPPARTNLSTSSCVWTATSSKCQCNSYVDWQQASESADSHVQTMSYQSPGSSQSSEGSNTWIIFVVIACFVCLLLSVVAVLGAFYIVKKKVMRNYETIND